MKHRNLLLALSLTFGVHTATFAAQTAPVTPSLSQSQYISNPINYVEIDPQAYASNLAQMHKMIGPKVKLCVVMKSNAYGHGI